MCGRASLTSSPEELEETFGLAEAPTVAPRYNISPSEPILTILSDAAGERRPVGKAVLQQKTHDRQRDAGGSDQKHAAPVEEPARHQHDDDVKHRDGEPERREGVDGETRCRKGNGDEGEERRRGE